MPYSKIVQASRDKFIYERGVTIQENTFCILDEYDDEQTCTWTAQILTGGTAIQIIVRASITTGKLITSWLGFDKKEIEALRNYFKAQEQEGDGL